MSALNRFALAAAVAALVATPQIAAAAALTVGGEQAMIAAQQASPGFVRQDGKANVAMQSAQEKPAVDVKARVGSRARADIAWAPNQERDSRSLADARARVLERTPSTVLR